MITVADELFRVESEDTCTPDPADWAWYCQQTRTPEPPSGREAYLPAADWFRCQASWHASQSHFEGDYHDLIATTLNDVRCLLESRKCRTAAELVREPGTPYHRLDLSSVRVPEYRLGSDLAALLDEDAQYYLDLGTDLGRLAAQAILLVAAAAETLGARTVCEYHDALDAEASAVAAYDDVFGDAAGIDYPLW